jgi:DNA-binding IscR family transcriptional regulator
MVTYTVTSSRFATAVHILTLLAYEREEALTSDYIAGSVNTNPVVIRRILKRLAIVGLVISVRGASGGSRLGKPPGDITLLDVVLGRGKRQAHRRARPATEPAVPGG